MQDDDGNDLFYAKCLQKLITMPLEWRRQHTDMVFMYEVLHDLVDCSAVNFGLDLKTSRNRGDDIKLNQRRATTHASSQFFAVSAPSAWNKLSLNITGCTVFQN